MTTSPTSDPDQAFRGSLDLSDTFAGQIRSGGADVLTRLQEARRLEIMPVGRMRGRTFQNAYVIVDEAQNMNVRNTRMPLPASARIRASC